MSFTLNPPQTQETFAMKTVEPLVAPTQQEAVQKMMLHPEKQKHLESQADSFIDSLFTVANQEQAAMPTPDLFKDKIQVIQELGNEDMSKAKDIANALLDINMKNMANSSSPVSKNIAKDMVDLRMMVDKLNPASSGIDFANIGASVVKGKKLFGLIPLPNAAADKVKRYFMQYQTGQQNINAILEGLKNGKALLARDNQLLEQEKHKSWQNMENLRANIFLCHTIQSKIEQRLANEKMNGAVSQEVERIIQQDILFPIQQKTLDLETQLAASMTGYLAYDLIRQTNNELINGVSRCENTTVSVLKQAVVIANSVYHQSIVLDAVNSVKSTTENMILQTTAMLKQQGTEIYKNSTETTISIDVLQKGFDNLIATMDIVNNYRSQALEKMKKDNDLLIELNQKAHELTDNARMSKATALIQQ